MHALSRIIQGISRRGALLVFVGMLTLWLAHGPAQAGMPVVSAEDIGSLVSLYRQHSRPPEPPPAEWKSCPQSGNWWDNEIGRPGIIADAVIIGLASRKEWEGALRCYTDRQRGTTNPANEAWIAWARLGSGLAPEDAE